MLTQLVNGLLMLNLSLFSEGVTFYLSIHSPISCLTIKLCDPNKTSSMSEISVFVWRSNLKALCYVCFSKPCLYTLFIHVFGSHLERVTLFKDYEIYLTPSINFDRCINITQSVKRLQFWNLFLFL